jgi:hypothetical protein
VPRLLDGRKGDTAPSNSRAAAAPAAPPADDQPRQGGAAEAGEEKTAAEWDVELGEAAKKGMTALQNLWAKIPREHQGDLQGRARSTSQADSA